MGSPLLDNTRGFPDNWLFLPSISRSPPCFHRSRVVEGGAALGCMRANCKRDLVCGFIQTETLRDFTLQIGSRLQFWETTK